MVLVLTSLNAETANLIGDANLLLKLVPLRAKQSRKLDLAMLKRRSLSSSRAITPRYK